MNSPTTPPDLPFLRIDKKGDVFIDIHVVPNASATQLAGLHGEKGHEALRLRLKAPPVDGKANEALIKWFAGCTGAPQSAITLVRGTSSRRKQLRLSAAAASVAIWDALMAAVAPEANQALLIK